MYFDFGKNWIEYSSIALNHRKANQARYDFMELFKGIDLRGKLYLDIGFGQGLSLLTATECGAITFGIDVNPLCREALNISKKYFSNVKIKNSSIVIGSLLDQNSINKLHKLSPDENGLFDIVYSWGVLHHTGNMKKAMENMTDRYIIFVNR